MRICIVILISFMNVCITMAAENELSNNYDASHVVASVVRLHTQADKNWPEHLMKLDATRNRKEFDVAKYFNVLKHISPPEGYILDYVYMYVGDGLPYLYLRETKASPFKTSSEYEAALGGWEKATEIRKNLSTKLRLDGSPESYFEYLVFDILAGQFYLADHCNYRDDTIITKVEDLEAVIKEIENDDYKPLTDEQRVSAKKVDFTPRVVWKDNIAEVSVVIFSKWGGLDRVTKQVARTYPHAFKNKKVEKLVSYDCGVEF